MGKRNMWTAGYSCSTPGTTRGHIPRNGDKNKYISPFRRNLQEHLLVRKGEEEALFGQLHRER
jgi:hypothetical protein